MQRFSKFSGNPILHTLLTSAAATITGIDPQKAKTESYRQQTVGKIEMAGTTLKALAKDLPPNDFKEIVSEFDSIIGGRLGDFSKQGSIHAKLGDLKVDLGKLASPGANGTGHQKDQRPQSGAKLGDRIAA
ncbi:hypothetical protein K8Q93_03450 [Candidatus Parcubacteria bacterium]|nr:hypothetical protein [Candidatus Parcubacteria bacterium]